MESLQFAGKSYILDAYGFLDPSDQWDEDFAQGMAVALGMDTGLSDRHWQVISYLRQQFLDEMSVPVVVVACLQNNMRLGELRQLFPTGYHRGACKIAGINYKFIAKSNIWLTYETTGVFKSHYPLDRLGFLLDHMKWDEDFAVAIYNEMNLPGEMTEEHWSVIRFLRNRYENNREIPTIYETCTANLLGLGELRDLFPAGYRRGACRMAGLPFFA